MTERAKIVQRAAVKGRITRIANYISEVEQRDIEDISLEEIRVREEELESLITKFDELQTSIEMEGDQEKGTDYEIERSTVETKYYAVKATILKLLNTLHTSNDSNTSNQGNKYKTLVRLPKLELPCFSGDIQEWTAFKNLFECAMNGSGVPTLQRLQYLKSSLKGEAAALINSLLITEENYKKAFNILKERYENQTIIVNFHLKNFVNHPAVTKSNLKHFVTTLQQSLDSLAALDLPVDKWDVLLVYLITQKLDNSLRASWELNRKESSIPKMKELKEFLSQRVTALELINDKFTEKPTQSFKPNTKLSHVTTSVGTYRKCTLCQQQHMLNKCPNFLEFSVEKRIEFIKNNNLCFNCLQPYNARHKCSKIQCSTCHGKHHSLIHLTNPPRKVNINTATATNNQQLQSTLSNSQLQSNINSHTNTNSQTNIQQQLSYIPVEMSHSSALNTNSQNQLQKRSNIQTNPQIIHATPSTVCVSQTHANQILLSTALIRVQDSAGDWHNARALLDSGSEVHIVTHRLAIKLNSKFYYNNHIIQGIGDTGKQTQLCINTNIASRLSGFNVNLDLIVMENITAQLPHNYIDIHKLNIPKQHQRQLADPGFYIPSNIDILIGAQLFYSLLLSNRLSLGSSQPQMIETVFGWIITGSISLHDLDRNTSQSQVSLHVTSQPSLDDILTRFWQQEEIKSKTVLTPDQRYCEDTFLESIHQLQSGNFCVEMPIQKQNIQLLGNSFNIAYRSLLILEAKFNKSPELFHQYKAFIEEFIQLGHAEYISNFQQQEHLPHCYLPHLGVLRPDSRTTKLRTVVNASSKTSSGVSLNDILYEGPNIYNEVLDILLRFRMYKFVFSCDIIKMFRSIFVNENQQPFLRILWRDSISHPLKCLQLKTVTYGTKCAPYLACRTLTYIAEQYKNIYPEAAKVVQSECYMDDFLSGADTIKEAQLICNQLIQLLEKGKFKLHKWSSNNPKVIEHILQSEKSSTNSIYEFSPDYCIKTLGIKWLPQSDLLGIAIPNPKHIKFTKRNVLSVIAQIYDPIGILAPVVIKAKILMQDIWKLKIDWDSELPDNMKQTWLEFYQGISHLHNIHIPRYHFSDLPAETTLLGFCDASQRAYGACLYLRATYKNKKPSCSFVIAKTKVSPIKTQSLPRLELCGALLLAQLVQKVLEAFKNKFLIKDIKLFTDSLIVLSWIKSPYKKLHVYISNRLMEIIELTKQEMWNYVNTKSNPADLVTRGISSQQLIQSSLWWNGPDWVIDNPQQWPISHTTKDLKIEQDIVVSGHISSTTCSSHSSYFYDYIQKFSKLSKLTRVIAYVLKFKNILKTKASQNKYITTLELKTAHDFIIKVVQNKVYSKEIQALQKNKADNNIESLVDTLKTSSLRKLNPFIDENQILRLGGRIANSDIPYNHAHPIILPQKEHITTLIIQHYHFKLLHSGIQNTLCNLRLKYWVVNGRNEVKKVIHRCVRCIRFSAKACEQQMAILPYPRVSLVRPFLHVGVDFSGAISIRTSMSRNCRFIKSYICLFVCMSTKALHLELVSDLSTQALICALKRFISRRGICQCIYSDNATNFKGAHNELNDLYKMFKNDVSYSQLIDFCNANSIDWKFTIPLASHMGGLYEAGIKSVKGLLKKHLNNVKLTYELLNTVLVQIEGILNSRPMCALKDTPETDLVCLTPAHFLIGVPISDIPEPNVLDKVENRLSLYQKISRLKQKFWFQFYNNYLSELQPRSKWLQIKTNLKIGDVVLLKEEHVPPTIWPLGRVISVNKNTKDNLVRSVKIKTCKGEYVRPINKLILLPCQ